ncbi:hypothetical protein BCR36DRAFT_361674 [Piromyces finnis]|uniref:Chitin-binding type-1 domain-containing protein n=1 Tax=Piromyces finnis TaxID=1754191 RepID=A0A1Y1UXI6_9FUNG|nr:hypothetical protein BCR36DRAFT_361674 [Piromyces finnis]|eukprot:ORX42979.1 hypothetical protein BCR36DRAFT_361674 [Piromyces finnis]
MKFYTLFITFTLFIFGTFANQEMGPDQDPGVGRCNVYKKCPLKKQYRNSKLSEKELEKDKYHQCCSYYSHCGESIEYCGVGCQFGDCLPEYKDQTRQLFVCHSLYLQNRCSNDCPCLNGACCSKYGYCGTTKEFCDEGNRMTSTLATKFITLSIPTASKTTTTTTPTPTIKVVKGMCGKDIGSCSEGHCCSKYGWCGSTKDHCYISKGCQSEFGKCQNDSSSTKETKKSTTTTTSKKTSASKKVNSTTKNTITKKTSKTLTKKAKTTSTIKKIAGKCGEGYGKCPKGLCCSKYGWCGSAKDYCAKGCQPKYGKCLN